VLNAIAGLIPVYNARSASVEKRSAARVRCDRAKGPGAVAGGLAVVRAAERPRTICCFGATPLRNKARAAALLERVYEIFPKLKERRTQRAGTMSGGERQMLAVGRALMSDPNY